MGKLYRPSNGSEGEWFQHQWCNRCEKDRREDRPCKILSRSMAYDIDEPGYPREWVYAENGHPMCTKFEPIESHPRNRNFRINDKRQIGLPL